MFEIVKNTIQPNLNPHERKRIEVPGPCFG